MCACERERGGGAARGRIPPCRSVSQVWGSSLYKYHGKNGSISTWRAKLTWHSERNVRPVKMSLLMMSCALMNARKFVDRSHEMQNLDLIKFPFLFIYLFYIHYTILV